MQPAERGGPAEALAADGQGGGAQHRAGSWADDPGRAGGEEPVGATGKIDSCSGWGIEQEGWRWMSRKLLALPS